MIYIGKASAEMLEAFLYLCLIGNSADVKCDIMKNFLIGVIAFFSIILFCNTMASWLFASTSDYSLIALEFPDNSAKNWKLPNGYRLIYSPIKKAFKLETNISDEFCIWLNGGYPVCGMNESVIEDATTFKDSTTAKYYGKLYWQHEHPIFDNSFKPLTK